MKELKPKKHTAIDAQNAKQVFYWQYKIVKGSLEKYACDIDMWALYGSFRFETSAPGLPGSTCIMSFHVVPSYSFILIFSLVLL